MTIVPMELPTVAMVAGLSHAGWPQNIPGKIVLLGVESSVIGVVIDNNTWRVCFSPEQGYHIVKAEIQKDSKSVYLLDQVQFKPIESVPVPVSCVVKDAKRQYTYERTKIELKPDFTAIKAFESAISDGTGVTVEGMEGKYYWNSGQVVASQATICRHVGA